MRKASASALAAAWFLTPILAYAETPDLSVLSAYADDKGVLNISKLQADYAAQRARAAKTSPAPPAVVPAAPTPVRPAAPAAPTNEAAAPKPTFAVAVRQNFNDVGLFGPAKLKESVFDSHGASVSWTHDGISHNTLWSVEGVATAVWSIYPGYADPDATEPKILGIYASPYVQVDKSLNSNRKLSSKNVDTDGIGGAAEIGIDNLLGGQHYFHDRLGVVDDNIKGSRSISNVFEWIPVYSQLHIHFPYEIPGSPIRFRLDPELKVQYDSSTRGSVLDFAKQQEALRIGPQLSLVTVLHGVDSKVLSSFHLNAVLHYAEELNSHRPYWWFAPSLGYNLDEDGNFGVALDYKKGHDEISGQKMDIVKISLTGKL